MLGVERTLDKLTSITVDEFRASGASDVTMLPQHLVLEAGGAADLLDDANHQLVEVKSDDLALVQPPAACVSIMGDDVDKSAMQYVTSLVDSRGGQLGYRAVHAHLMAEGYRGPFKDRII